MVISLIHPSRSRAEKSIRNANDWILAANVETELIVSIDTSDPERHKYEQFYPSSKLIVNDNKSVVEATNHASKVATGDILVYLSDDFKCPDNWGNLVIDEFKKYIGPTLIKVDDCLQGFHVPVLTIPIMNREFYDALGYFWHPSYKSMFVDEDLYWTARKLNALKFAPNLKFPHEHPANGKAVTDETYERSAANWEQGKKEFSRRKFLGFPI